VKSSIWSLYIWNNWGAAIIPLRDVLTGWHWFADSRHANGELEAKSRSATIFWRGGCLIAWENGVFLVHASAAGKAVRVAG
jgi:hypothetical protein